MSKWNPQPRYPGSEEEKFLPGDRSPVPEPVVKNSDTTWALFQEVVDKEQQRYADTVPIQRAGEVEPVAVPVPSPVARPAGPNLHEKLLAELTRLNRVCPMPAQWEKFFEELVRGKRHPEIKSLAPPMTADAWSRSSSLAKRMTLKDQVAWAADHERTAEAYRFLSQLPESEWFHVGDREP